MYLLILFPFLTFSLFLRFPLEKAPTESPRQFENEPMHYSFSNRKTFFNKKSCQIYISISKPDKSQISC